MFKRACSRQLETQLNTLQKDGPAAWAALPEEELFTPAGFSSQQAEATASTSYSYWGSTFRAFFKNKLAVALLAALAAVVVFAFVQPLLPGQADPNLCAVDPATGIQYRNIAPGQQGFRAGPVGAHLGGGAHQPDHRLFRGGHRSRRGHYRRCAVGLCARAGFSLYRAVQHLR